MIFYTFNSFQTCPFESLLLSVGNELGETPRKDMKCNSSTAKTIKTQPAKANMFFVLKRTVCFLKIILKSLKEYYKLIFVTSLLTK